MIRTQIQLTEAQMVALRELAARRQVSIAELVRRGVDRIIASGGELGVTERRRRALRRFGEFRSGLGDLSERHDAYLAEDLDGEGAG